MIKEPLTARELIVLAILTALALCWVVALLYTAYYWWTR